MSSTDEKSDKGVVNGGNFIDYETVMEATREEDEADLKRIDLLAGDEPVDDEVLMDAGHDATFDALEFFLQITLHVLWPISLVWYPSRRWPQGARNQQLMFSWSLFSLTMHAMPLICWGLLVVFSIFPERFRDAGVTVNELFTVPMLLATSRIVLIALKYATLTSKERDKFFLETDQVLVNKWLLQTQLISGWLSQRDDVITAELEGSASRLSFKLEEMFFAVDEKSQAWDNLAKRTDSERGLLEKNIHCSTIITVLLRAARAKAPVLSPRTAAFLGFLFAVLPRTIAAINGETIFNDSLVVAAVSLSLVATTISATIFLVFLTVNVAHYYRMAVVNRWLALLIRVSFDAHPHFPQIQLNANSQHGSHNTLAWLQCRSLMCYFGKRYEARLDFYMVMVAFISVIAIAVPALRVLQAGGFGGDSDEAELKDDLRDLRANTFTWTSLFLFSITMAVMTVTVLFAADGNRQFDYALASFAQHRIKLRTSKCLGCSPNERDTYFFEETLQLAKEELDLLNRVHVLRVAGQPADTSMALSIATTSTTVVAYVLAALFELLM